MEIVVIKRDKSREPYNEEKIKKVVIAAGLYPGQAIELAASITRWLQESNITRITSLQIRDRVIRELNRLNQYTANLYTWYEGTKEKQSTN